MNCGIIAVVMGIILSIIGNFFEHIAQKHNRQNFEHNSPGPTIKILFIPVLILE